jgi:hypothetical protein
MRRHDNASAIGDSTGKQQRQQPTQSFLRALPLPFVWQLSGPAISWHKDTVA